MKEEGEASETQRQEPAVPVKTRAAVALLEPIVGIQTQKNEHVPPEVAKESFEQVKAMLGKTLRILISDGRLVEGEFQCMDKDLNFILGQATEYFGMYNRPEAEVTEETISHRIGMVMVPGKHIVRIMLLEEETEPQAEV